MTLRMASLLAALVLAGCATAPHPGSTAALAVLGSPDAGLHEKARACQELAVFGGREAVPALAALLEHEHLADYARSGLENIPDPAAGNALRQALPRLKGRFLAGAVNSLGVRREIAAIPDLERLAADAGSEAASEALASLGMIATPAAAQTLRKILAEGPDNLRIPAAHASLDAAARLSRGGNRRAARELLDDVVRALPPGHLRTAAEARIAAL